ncbi:hypothetical protein [Kitasatospora sp. NPDC094011]|uniref:hypothetical protein n=1 Tax=Kitasatospora sp. NPDC094011 TaxID=3364090 RepID=UPI0038303770
MSITGQAPGTRRWLPRRRTGADAAPAPAATLHEVGPHFVIAPGAADGPDPVPLPAELTDALAALTPVVGTVTVLAAAADAQPVLLGRLDELARTAAARKAATLVLAASGLATAAESGRRPAQRIAELAATSIVAPDGLVTLRPDGTLLTTGDADTAPSSWWLFTPDGRTRRLGAVWPLPGTGAARGRAAGAAATAGGVPATAGATATPEPTGPAPAVVPGRVTAAPSATAGATATPPTPAPAAPGTAPEPAAAAPATAPPPDGTSAPLTAVLPHGRWFHGGPAPALPPAALLGAESVPGTPVLVVGRPGVPLPPVAEVAAEVAAALAARPDGPGASPADPLISAPWATVPELVALAGELAVELGREVRAAVGLPTRTAHGCSSLVLTADAAPAWEPWLTELTACPELGRVIASAWRPLPSAFAACGPALHQAPVAGWRLEAVPAGLWLRPEETPHDRGPRLLDPAPDRPTLIAGSADRTAPAEVLDVLDDLLSALTTPGTPTPRLLLPGAPDSPEAANSPSPQADPATGTATDTGTPPPAEPLTPATAPTTAVESTGTPDTPAPAPDPVPAPVPVPAPAAPETPDSPAAPRLLVPTTAATAATAGRVSTPAERAAFRALLGTHFHRYASRAEQAALRMPALRAQDREDLKEDLAAVHLHHIDTGLPVHRAELVAAARRSAPGAGPLAPYLACLGSGLRRLPNHRGAVLLGAEADEEVLGQYARGVRLVEPAPVVGTAEPEVVPGTAVEFLVWSATGRRTSAIAEAGDPEVVFPPGTCFTVLDVLPGEEDRPARVLLREAGPASAPDAAGDEQDRARLLAWQERRDRLPTERLRAPARPERLLLTPGVAL